MNIGIVVAGMVWGATAEMAVTATATPTPDLPTLSLPDALGELDRQNLTLAQARARADEASGVARQATSALLPTLSAGASYTRNSAQAVVNMPPGAARPGLLYIQPLETLSASGTLRVPLVVPSAWFDAAQARGQARAADLTADASRATVRAAFAQSAEAAAANEEIVAASERAVASAEELARSAERRLAAGTAAPLDVLRSKTDLVRRESDLAGARANLGRAQLVLGVLLGRDGPVRVALAAAAEPADAPVPALVSEAVGRRPELAAARAQSEAAEAGVRSAWARIAPQVSASGSAFAQDVPLPTGDKQGWRATVDLTWALYDGGFRYGKRRQAEAQRAFADAAAEAQRLEIVQEVQDAARDLAVARERLRLAVTEQQLASDAAASARRSYEAGIASSLDVIEANDRLYAAETGFADARARLGQARVALERAVGR